MRLVDAGVWLIDLVLAVILGRLIYKQIFESGRAAGKQQGMAIGARWSEQVAHKAFHAGMQVSGIKEAADYPDLDALRDVRIIPAAFVEQQREASREQRQ